MKLHNIRVSLRSLLICMGIFCAILFYISNLRKAYNRQAEAIKKITSASDLGVTIETHKNKSLMVRWFVPEENSADVLELRQDHFAIKPLPWKLMSSFPRLKTISIEGNYFDDSSLIQLSLHSSNIETLKLAPPNHSGLNQLTDNSAASILGFHNLKSLHIRSGHITDRFLESIGKSYRLERLTIGSSIEGHGLQYLHSLTNLSELSLVGNPLEESAIVQLQNLINLEKLSLRATPIRGCELDSLKTLLSLEFLDLSLSDLDDEGVSQLPEMKSLKTLLISETRVTDSGVRFLSHLPNLKVLDLSYTPITNRSLSHLKHLEHLEVLFVYKTQLTDECLDTLKCMPNLSIVGLDSDVLSPNSRRELQLARPKLNIH